ncbi:MAG: hypothetical protein R2772_11665, partial [Chitinophagales bacterium]
LSNYEFWTAAFNPTSSYVGSWEKGSKMYFVGCDENGKQGGMISEIVENQAASFVSIKHYGILDGEQEITSGAEVDKWTGGLENYSFTEKEGITTLRIDIDVLEDYLEFFDSTWPLALKSLKEIAEK